MLLSRRFEEKLIAVNNSGTPLRVGHPYIGEEAVAVGVIGALGEGDTVVSNHRSHGHAISSGIDPNRFFAELADRVTGTCGGRAGEMNIADSSVGLAGASEIVGAGLTYALGFALAAKIQGTARVTAAFFGDGASNQGAWHEAMNLAAIWTLPVLFVCENNGYAQSTPVEYAVAGGTIAGRASGYGTPSVVVDGQDALAIAAVARDFVGQLRSGAGPALIEATTYRYHGHFYGDMHGRYRSGQEVGDRISRDCIVRLRYHVIESNEVTDEGLEAIDREIDEIVQGAADFALASPYPDARDLLANVYSDIESAGAIRVATAQMARDMAE
jgi:pyruvate dehydrogenase E1 component alpha subunit